MEKQLKKYFEIRHRSDFESEQKNNLLLLFATLTFSYSFLLGVMNFFGGATLHAFSLFGLSLLCLPLFIMIKTNKYYYSSSIIFTILTIMTVNLNLAIDGSIQDSGVVAYPIIIVASTFLIGRKSAFINFVLTAASLAFISYLFSPDPKGLSQYSHVDSYMELFTILLLLSCTAFLVWIIIKYDETNLQMVNSSRQELYNSYEHTLESWAKVLEYRDRETEGHCQRVRLISEWLAKRIGLSEEEIRHIGYGALLHDIGKLAIPDSILLKRESLDQDERDIMVMHTEYALEMLSQIPFLSESISVPYSHHERWDGKGYPCGLKGKEIPIMARIFALVDQ